MPICDELKILNPDTNKCVLKNGRIGQRILAELKSNDASLKPKIFRVPMKECPKGKIRNPLTQICVNENGKIGRKLIIDTGKGIKTPIKIKTPIPKKTPIKNTHKEVRTKCNIFGLKQSNGTCWFNAALNGILLGEYSSIVFKYLIMEEFKKLSNEERNYVYDNNIGNEIEQTCPIKFGKMYMYKYFIKILCSTVKDIDYSIDHASMIMKNMKINNKPLYLIDGGFSLKGIKKILGFFFNERQFVTLDHNLLLQQTSIQLKSDATFLLFGEGDYTNNNSFKEKLHRIQDEVIANGQVYLLDHIVMSIKFKNMIMTHCVVGYKCNNTPLVYDSNDAMYVQMNWLDFGSETLNIQMAKHTAIYGNFKSVHFAYICYIKKERIPRNTKISKFCTFKRDFINTPRKSEDKVYKIYSINGLGCSTLSDDDSAMMKNDIVKASKIKDVVIKCNKSMKDTLLDITKLACRVPLKHDAFVHEICNEIEVDLKAGKTVIVLGHSYGGAVASRIAEYFNDFIIYNSKIIIRTMGSIYIPATHKVDKINIKHALMPNDVCLKCLDIKNNEARENVHWLQNNLSPYKKSYMDVFKVFGSKKRWEIHNSYGSYLYETLLPSLKK